MSLFMIILHLPYDHTTRYVANDRHKQFHLRSVNSLSRYFLTVQLSLQSYITLFVH
jgi:hypothetical protein